MSTQQPPVEPRIPSSELSPTVRRLRRAQVILAVSGMGAFLLALIGGALQSRLMAWIGLGGFVLCLITLLVVGVFTWARRS
jgi:hypothetical protein